jgi:type VI secretion system protein ImpG
VDREFLDLYNRELELLKEHAREFAEEYPGIAERLGGLLADRMDPMIAGLLEGSAFLAARVQLKLKAEFPEFTANLLEQLIPNFLAPTPSVMIVRAQPEYGDPALKDGKRIQRGAYLDATYLERGRRIACRYQLVNDITLWPFALTQAEYLPSTAQLQALGVPAGADARSGLRLSLTTRMSNRLDAEISDADAVKKPDFHAAGCKLRDLPIHLVGPEAEAVALYEQLFAQRLQIFIRHLDEFGDPVVFAIDPGSLAQIGLEEGQSLFPVDTRIFHGFSLLKDYFVFARHFLGFRLIDLAPVMPRIAAKTFDIIVTFSEANPRLTASINPSMFSLYSASAINLFEKTTDRVPIKSHQFEYHVVPDRSRPLDFEPHRLVEVFAHYPGRSDKIPVLPLYSAPQDPTQVAARLFYSVRRLPRRRSSQERRYGSPSDYTGTEMFLSLIEPAGAHATEDVAEISIKALCSNRHLTEALPIGESGADFTLLEDTKLALNCVAGPTPPREPVVGALRSRTEVASTGSVTWRLINMLSLNHLGLISRGAGRNAQSLREILSLFADLRDVAIERRIGGIRALESKPIVRRVRRDTGVGAARGLEITVTVDEKSFEGSGAFLLGAVLDRFFAEYAALNSFTQTVIRSVERGEIARWPVRLGLRRRL